jgi:hypothetical protein
MKQINNLEDLRYRKLYLRSEIKLKEQKIGNRIAEINKEINQADFKNEIVRSAMNNPVLIFNLARLTFGLIGKMRKKRSKRRKKNKASI